MVLPAQGQRRQSARPQAASLSALWMLDGGIKNNTLSFRRGDALTFYKCWL